MINRTKKDGLSRWLSFFVPMIFPAVFFESGLFLVLSPLPLFILTLKNKSWVTLVALFTNVTFLYSVHPQSWNILILAFAFWTSVGVLFPLLIIKTGKVLKSSTVIFLLILTMILAYSFLAAQQASLSVVDFYREQIDASLKILGAADNNPLKKIIEDQGYSTVIKQILGELPSAILVTIVFILWINLLFASRFLGDFLSKHFWEKFKLSDAIVWPTLISAAAYIFGQHAIQLVGLNGIKFFLALYALQGLSIISFLLNRYRVMGFFRALVIITIILMAIPLVISLGFFDQWFDFRKKFGQSLKTK